MVSISLGKSGYLGSPASVAAGLALRVEQLADDAADFVPVLPSSTGRPLHVSTPPELFFVLSASTVVPVAATSSVSPDVALGVALFSVPPVSVTFVVASCDAAPVTTPITTSFAFPPPIPAHPTFPLSPLALFASAPRSLNTPASAAVPGAALRELCSRLA